MTTLLPALAGANMIYGGGMLEMGITMSFGQLVMDNEIIAMTRKVLEGIPVNDKTLAVDVIKSVGARGHFLAEEHTVKHMRKLSETRLMDRRMRQFWVERGAKDLATTCDEKAREILETHKPEPLPEHVHK
ncbi:MAG: trimethylamine methyltransferase family protein, partial [Clostridia bacterium]|nr:trimethylamine methyltransferase family protein [Clostridia bacterium]